MRPTKLDEFHKWMTLKYGLRDFFARNPDIERYFIKRIHKPYLEVMKKLKEGPDYKVLKKGIRLYLKMHKYLEETTSGGEKWHLDQEKFVRTMSKRKTKALDYITASVPATFATYITSRAAMQEPNTTSYAALAGTTVLTGMLIALAGRARFGNPIGYKIAKRVKTVEELEAITAMIFEEYSNLVPALQKAAKELERRSQNV